MLYLAIYVNESKMYLLLTFAEEYVTFKGQVTCLMVSFVKVLIGQRICV